MLAVQFWLGDVAAAQGFNRRGVGSVGDWHCSNAERSHEGKNEMTSVFS